MLLLLTLTIKILTELYEGKMRTLYTTLGFKRGVGFVLGPKAINPPIFFFFSTALLVYIIFILSFFTSYNES